MSDWFLVENKIVTCCLNHTQIDKNREAQNCPHSGTIISDASQFILKDKEKEKQFGFSLTKSLEMAQNSGGLLRDYSVHVTKNVKPEPLQMQGERTLRPPREGGKDFCFNVKA